MLLAQTLLGYLCADATEHVDPATTRQYLRMRVAVNIVKAGGQESTYFGTVFCNNVDVFDMAVKSSLVFVTGPVTWDHARDQNLAVKVNEPPEFTMNSTMFRVCRMPAEAVAQFQQGAQARSQESDRSRSRRGGAPAASAPAQPTSNVGLPTPAAQHAAAPVAQPTFNGISPELLAQAMALLSGAQAAQPAQQAAQPAAPQQTGGTETPRSRRRPARGAQTQAEQTAGVGAGIPAGGPGGEGPEPF